MRPAEQAGSRSADAIHAEREQLEQQAETILFSHGSLYAIIGMLTLAVLFCAGVLAYSVRRNDLLKTEYRRVMEAFAMKGSTTTRFPTEPDPTETPETMGPGPKLDDATQDAILLLLTRKPISNIQFPNLNKTRTTKPTPPATSITSFDDDLDSGGKRMPQVTRSPRPVRQDTTVAARNETTTSLSSGGNVSVASTLALTTTLRTTLNESDEAALEMSSEYPELEISSLATTATGALWSEVPWTSSANSSDYDNNSTQSVDNYGSDDDSGEDDA
ncbi:hypothetical protein HPB50_026159 [Hyalomma asiaticum]|uniref:Uncharacterized protein n=1 Tax=Hyalomma asiaticum TaxID=266040 RepID=A0ACB7S6K3_HYAAI|nr:hypothetical protein HPB50_026159 [Hyalomma asiaticum]